MKKDETITPDKQLTPEKIRRFKAQYEEMISRPRSAQEIIDREARGRAMFKALGEGSSVDEALGVAKRATSHRGQS